MFLWILLPILLGKINLFSPTLSRSFIHCCFNNEFVDFFFLHNLLCDYYDKSSYSFFCIYLFMTVVAHLVFYQESVIYVQNSIVFILSFYDTHNYNTYENLFSNRYIIIFARQKERLCLFFKH